MGQIFFADDQVEISEGKARFGKTYYPISNIGAVTVETKKIGYRFPGVLMIVIGLGLLGWTSSSWSWLLVGLGVFGLFKRPDFEHTLVLSTSSGNKQAYTSRDAKVFEKIRMALEEAIAAKS